MTKIPLGRMMEYLVDREGAITIDDIEGKQYAGRWKTANVDGPGFGFTNDVYWIKLTVENRTAGTLEFYLEQAYSLIDNIKFYAPGKNGYTEIEVGRKKPFKERPFLYRTFIFPLELQKHSSATYYLRYKTTSSMNIVLVLWSHESFNKSSTLENYMLAIFNAIIIAILFYNILLFFIIKWLEYLYFCLWAVIYMVFMAALNGTAFEFLWPNSPGWGSLCVPPLLCLLLAFIALFCMELVGLRIDRKKFRYKYILYYMALGVIGVPAALFVATFFIPYRYAMMLSTLTAGLVFPMICVMGAVLIIKERNRQAIFGLIAFMPVLVGAMVYVFKTFSLLQTNFFTEWAVHFGSVSMSVLCSIVLADKVNNIRKELAVLNVGLEQKVEARTRELQAANEELEIMNDQLIDTNTTLIEAQHIASLDMDMAKQVQRTLLPEEPKNILEWDIALAYRPMSGVSGDLYDFYVENSQLEGIAIFDVSGHGIASGLITMIARSVFFRNFTRGKDKPLKQVVQDANHELISEIDKVDNYLTGILLRFTGDMVEYVNAGHSDLIHKSAGSGTANIVNMPDHGITGMFLGAHSLDYSYEQMRFSVSPGDVLILYTDCLLENRNQSKEEYGIERLAKSLQDAPDGSAKEILDFILKRFYDYVGDSEIKDDLTAIVAKKN